MMSHNISEPRFRRYTQESAYSSPWTLSQRVRIFLWQCCWTVFCRWTPKPFNRWRLAWLKVFGATISGTPFVHQRARIHNPQQLTMHDRACLGDRANAYSLGRIEIHRGATIAQEAYLCTGTHDFDDRHSPLVTAPIVIGAYAFVAARAFVMPGVTVSEGAILGAMSLAAKDLSPWTVYAGTPATSIRLRKTPPLRVNIVQGAFFPVPPLQGGAVEKVWYGLGQELARLGCEVTHVSRRYEDLPLDENRNGVRYIRIAGFDACANEWKYKLRDLRYSLRVRRKLPPADVTVTNTFWLPMLLQRSRHGATYVHVARFPRRQMWLYRRVQRIQPVSETVAAAIRCQTPSVAALIRVLPNPLPKGWLIADAPKSDSHSPVILYVGRLHPEKGIDLLIDAFAKIPDQSRNQWNLVLVGSADDTAGGGGNSFLTHLKSLAITNRLNVEFVGPVYDSEALKAQFDRANIFVYPSRAARGEAFGLAPLEAMARGIATVTSSLDCFKDFIRDGENGLMFPLNSTDPAAALAIALTTLIEDPALRQHLRNEGLATARRYDVERIAVEYLRDLERSTHV